MLGEIETFAYPSGVDVPPKWGDFVASKWGESEDPAVARAPMHDELTARSWHFLAERDGRVAAAFRITLPGRHYMWKVAPWTRELGTDSACELSRVASRNAEALTGLTRFARRMMLAHGHSHGVLFATPAVARLLSKGVPCSLLAPNPAGSGRNVYELR